MDVLARFLEGKSSLNSTVYVAPVGNVGHVWVIEELPPFRCSDQPSPSDHVALCLHLLFALRYARLGLEQPDANAKRLVASPVHSLGALSIG